MALILSTICPTASHNVPAVVLAGEADLVENEGVLHRGLATRIRGAGDRDVACRRRHGGERRRSWLRYLEGS